MINKGCSLEGLAMRSSGAATGTRATTQACSISTGIGETTATTTCLSADPSDHSLDVGMPTEGSILVESIPEVTPKARQQAKPKTAAGPKGAAVESGSDFYQMTMLDNLFLCWRNARKNKTSSLRVQRFDADPLSYLLKIQQRLRDRSYTFGPYKTFTVREKKWRDVVDAPMKDRVVHWMLYSYLLPIWRPRFIHDTFGNLPNRGTHAAIQRLADFCRAEGTEWVLQIDISKYFYAIPHSTLKEKTLRYVGDHDVRQLMCNLIDSFCTGSQYDNLFHPASPYRTTPAKGMPIGNLTSQLFANIYLNDFDHWVKEKLRIKHYIRYVDDIVILGKSKAELQAICFLLASELNKLGLTVHPKKIRIAHAAAGIPFLGYVVWPRHVSAGQRIRRRYHYRLREHEAGVIDRAHALNSYRAALKHTGSTI